MFHFKLRCKKEKIKTIKEMMNSTTFEFKIYAYQENIIKSSDKSKNKEDIWNKNNSQIINIQFI